MKCPYCDSNDTKVIDSRATEDNTAIRRRRLCQSCNKRFSTYERYEDRTLMVIKKDDTRESFDRSKLINGIVKSCEKRPVSIDQIEQIANEIELEINHLGKKEVSSTTIGKFVCDKLKNIDPVAYVRFASVYREFKDVESFYEELKNLKDEN
ncbi:transcriptional repressor NrdR [Anaerococcus sp. AGMB00486]|uniref:Transcriptional repressor NrdR n=2 Tax=Anaerococcus TaxID=165779 RepID=A0ABX2NBC5_9FIRM|nr:MULTISPECIES: transcriptional regulator NrdR [Anaerococcus]MDY3005519.1 transcriptional regulator NrdR [Anaerococcus porci]MSS78221.1 transcriptional repressor NrdR [Anaerococcus porci]NVF11979.1 transcriptional repressor NrdR [Anaerococcus faecalis]